MDQFDICPLRSGQGNPVVILQHRLSHHLDTCIVAPLVPASQLPPIERMRPLVRYRDRDHVIAMDRLAAVARRSIDKRVGSVASERDPIIAAIDLLFTGY
jgi:toxin CcdB